MKKLLLIGLVVFIALFSLGSTRSAQQSDSRQLVIGLSPFLDNKVKDEVYRGIVRLIIEDLPLATRVSIYDAYHLRTIAQVEIPDVRAFQSSKTRANQFSRAIGDVREFLARQHEKPVAARLSFNEAIRLPQFMDFIASNLGGGSEAQPLTVLLLGSPLYMDAKEPAFSMMEGYFPSDGHLSAARDKSVFALESRGGALSNVVVHFGYFGDPWVSEVHKDKIARFWSLYFQGQGARLASFTGDLATVFAAAKNPARGELAQRHKIDPAQTKVEMLRITRDVGVADWITRDGVSGANTPPARTVGPMKIGIRWKGQIDLDLYARGGADAEMLFFQHMRSPEGYYYKDHRSSPEREYEFIEFESPVDVWKVEARINFFEGRVPEAPAGEIRIEFDGKIYTGQFALAARRGNQGRSGARQTAFWTDIDVPGILKLR
jgi:hypothetical protein